MKYQDELEAGRRSRKPEFSIAEQVEQYRRKQLRKVCDYHTLLRLSHLSLSVSISLSNTYIYTTLVAVSCCNKQIMFCRISIVQI